MKFLSTIALIVLGLTAQAQVLNKFVWDALPLTKAAVGPDAISVSGAAVSGTIAAPLNYGINPGLPKSDINLVLPGATFNVPSLQIDLFFRMEESVAGFFKRGSQFDFGMSGNKLYVTFTYKNATTGSPVTVNATSIYNMANDHAFHEYTFRYDSVTGTANIMVDKAIVYTYNGVANSPLYWNGAGNVTVGDLMDATGGNVTVLSQLTISTFANLTLAADITSFSAALRNGFGQVSWTSTHEANLSAYEVERSSGTSAFTSISKLHPANGYTQSNAYSVTDSTPVHGTVYYRLKMTDKDGSVKYSSVVKLTGAAAEAKISCFPSLATTYTNLNFAGTEAGSYSILVSTFSGQLVRSYSVTVASGVQQVRIDLNSNMPKGNLIITVSNPAKRMVQSFKVAKA